MPPNMVSASGCSSLQRRGQLDGAMTLRHPVQVEPEDRRFQPREQPSDVQVGMHEHERGNVDDLRVESVVSQPLLDREPADGIHLVNRRDIDAVAVAQIREQHVVALAEVINAGSVQQEQVSLEPRRYMPVHHAGILICDDDRLHGWWWWLVTSSPLRRDQPEIGEVGPARPVGPVGGAAPDGGAHLGGAARECRRLVVFRPRPPARRSPAPGGGSLSRGTGSP